MPGSQQAEPLTDRSVDLPRAFQEERRSGIGGSDAAVILGLQPFGRTRLQLWAEKTGRADGAKENEAMYWGKVLEPLIAERYIEVTGRNVQRSDRMLVHPARDWMIAHVDRVIEASNGHDGHGVLECKFTGGFRPQDWKDEAPLVAQVQIQHYFGVTGAEWGSVAALVGNAFKYQDLERHADFISELMEAEEKFWTENVQADIPPDPEPSETDKKMLNLLYPQDSGATVVLPAISAEWDKEWSRIAGELREVNARKKDLETEKLGIENQLRAEMKDATRGELPDGGAFTLKTTNRCSYTVEATSYRTIRRVNR